MTRERALIVRFNLGMKVDWLHGQSDTVSEGHGTRLLHANMGINVEEAWDRTPQRSACLMLCGVLGRMCQRMSIRRSKLHA